MEQVDLVIIGGGPAGMSAAVSAYESGVRDMWIVEREEALGGILKQCIHGGFGLHQFKEELTGPEYADRYERKIEEYRIPYLLNTTVLSVTRDKVLTLTSALGGVRTVQAKAVILAMGCRERPRGALNITGTRPAGIMTAGTAQKFVNIYGYLPGYRAVILGSGDIGLIMARRMTLEGAKVEAVLEIMPYSGGLTRNIVQCLDDFGIPLRLSTTVVGIHGDRRIRGVTVARVDENRCVIPGTEEYLACDTLLLSAGLIPENELTVSCGGIAIDPATSGAVVDSRRRTDVAGIFAAGNVLHVHDLADYVSDEAEIAGRAAAEYILGGDSVGDRSVLLTRGCGIRYTVPQKLTRAEDTEVYFRTTGIFDALSVKVYDGDRPILSRRKRRMVPGEMQKITLKRSDIDGIRGDAVEIRIEE